MALPENTTFFDPAEEQLTAEFLEQGYVVREVADHDALDLIRDEVSARLAAELSLPEPGDPGDFLDHCDSRIAIEKLNDIRLSIYRGINGLAWLRPAYFRLGRPYIETLVGNELAMQNRINISIQMPSDRTSLLDIHADVFSGETPYQVVQWVPLVDVSGTKSMFYLPQAKSTEVIRHIRDYSLGGMAGLFDELKDDLVWLDVPYGSLVIFTPNCLHGNTVNAESSTRWSLNCRLTGLFTPYDSVEKDLGSFYLPITPRAVTKVGLKYRHPDSFEE